MATTWQVQTSEGWVSIPTPSSWTWSYQDLSSDDSGRDLSGTMHKDVVSVKRKNECSWQNVSPSVAKKIMTAAKSSVFVPFKYYDLFSESIKQITVYTGDIKATAQNAQGGLVWTVNLSFIEQ